MEDSISMQDKDSIEKEVSRTVYSLLKENLFAESLYLVDAYTRFLPSYTTKAEISSCVFVGCSKY
jgi:hypothetical protein